MGKHNELQQKKNRKPHGWDLGLGAWGVISWCKRGWIGRLVKMEQWSFGQFGLLSSPWHCWSLLGPLRNLMMNKLRLFRIDPSTIGLDYCGPWSNDVRLLTAFVKQVLLSILNIILLHVLRLISSMDREFQTWALFHKISWVNHWIWGFDSTRSKIIRVGNNGL